MRTIRAVLILTQAALLAPTANAGEQRRKKEPETITLSGCIQRDSKTPTQFTLTDRKARVTYKLSGADFREYLEHPVRIDGGIVVKSFTVKGGLQPNPNVAAQAGAMDPARAAVAGAQGIGPTGDFDVQELRVKTIQRTTGSCPE